MINKQEYDHRRKEYLTAKEVKLKTESEFKKARTKYTPIQKKIDQGKNTISNVDGLMKNTVSSFTLLVLITILFKWGFMLFFNIF